MRRLANGLRTLLALSVFLFVSAGLSEVSIDDPGADAGGPSLVHMALRGQAGPVPWGAVRQGIPASWLLNPDGDARGDGAPAITVRATDGRPQVAWSRQQTGRRDVVHSEWDGNEWTQPILVSEGVFDALGPDIAPLAGGGLAVAWWEDDGVFRQVFVRRRDAQGTWQAAEPVSPASETAIWPAVTADSTDLWVGWLRDPGTGTREVVVALDSEGWNPTVIGQTSYAGSENDGQARLELHSRDGRVWADWLLAPDRLATSRLDPSTGTWSAVEEIPCEDSPEGRDAARFEAKRRALGW